MPESMKGHSFRFPWRGY